MTNVYFVAQFIIKPHVDACDSSAPPYLYVRFLRPNVKLHKQTFFFLITFNSSSLLLNIDLRPTSGINSVMSSLVRQKRLSSVTLLAVIKY